jgi:hypothetical protein
MAAGNTYTQIASTTLGSTASTVTFSSIAGTYTDLVVVVNATWNTAGTSNLTMQLNGDTASNYSSTRILGTGSAVVSARQGTTYMMVADVDNSLFSAIINIQNYANTTTYKTVLSRMGWAAGYTGAYVSLWRSTAAITSFVIGKDGAGAFAAGSTFNLYGITAA